jgi:hypothetical protein
VILAAQTIFVFSFPSPPMLIVCGLVGTACAKTSSATARFD